MDPELRRVLEESMRTYQMETGQAVAESGQPSNENPMPDEANELMNAFADMDVDEEYLAQVSLEWIYEYTRNGKWKMKMVLIFSWMLLCLSLWRNLRMRTERKIKITMRMWTNIFEDWIDYMRLPCLFIQSSWNGYHNTDLYENGSNSWNTSRWKME